MFDIGITEEGLAGRKEEEDQEREEEEPAIPKFNPQPAKGSPIRPSHFVQPSSKTKTSSSEAGKESGNFHFYFGHPPVKE